MEKKKKCKQNCQCENAPVIHIQACNRGKQKSPRKDMYRNTIIFILYSGATN